MLQEYQKIEAKLKRYEDAIDALICCWVGTLYAEVNARPLGDNTAAIWCSLGNINRSYNWPALGYSRPVTVCKRRFRLVARSVSPSALGR